MHRMTTVSGPPQLLPNPEGLPPSSDGTTTNFSSSSSSFSQDREPGSTEKPQGSWDSLLPKTLMTSPSGPGPPASSPSGPVGQDRESGGQVPGVWEGRSQGGMPMAPKSEPPPPPPPSMNALHEERRRRRMSDTPQKTFFTHAEKVLLTRLVEKHRNGLFASNIRNKAETWRQLAQIYNSQPGVFPREPKQLKKCWENMKCRGIISPILQGERPRIRRFPRPLLMKPRSSSYGPPTMVPIRSAIPQSSPALLPSPSTLGVPGQAYTHVPSPRLNVAEQLRARAAGLLNPSQALGTIASLKMDVSQPQRPPHTYSSAPSFGGMRLPFRSPTSQPSQHPHVGEKPIFGSMPPAAAPPPPQPPPQPPATPPSSLPMNVTVVKIEPPDSDSPRSPPPPPREVQGFTLPASVPSQLFSPLTSGQASAPSSSSITQTPARPGGGEPIMHLPIAVGSQSPSHPPPTGQPPASPPSSTPSSPAVPPEEGGEESQDVFSGDETDQLVSQLKVRLLRQKMEYLEQEHEARMRVILMQEEYWRIQKEAASQHLRIASPPRHGDVVDSNEVNGNDT